MRIHGARTGRDMVMAGQNESAHTLIHRLRADHPSQAINRTPFVKVLKHRGSISDLLVFYNKMH